MDTFCTWLQLWYVWVWKFSRISEHRSASPWYLTVDINTDSSTTEKTSVKGGKGHWLVNKDTIWTWENPVLMSAVTFCFGCQVIVWTEKTFTFLHIKRNRQTAEGVFFFPAVKHKLLIPVGALLRRSEGEKHWEHFNFCPAFTVLRSHPLYISVVMTAGLKHGTTLLYK